MNRFGLKHSHQSKKTNYYETEENNFMNIEQNKVWYKFGRSKYEDKSKKTYSNASHNVNGKRK